jgi:hypothetical protein
MKYFDVVIKEIPNLDVPSSINVLRKRTGRKLSCHKFSLFIRYNPGIIIENAGNEFIK